MTKEASNSESGRYRGSKYVWAVLDSAFMDAAKKQLQQWEKLRQENHPATPLLYWGIAYAGAALVMVCAAMEAHANYLYRRATCEEDEMPNRLKLTADNWDEFERTRLKEKWLTVSETVTGQKVLDPGKAPFQEFCKAIWRRNQFVAHPKVEIHELPLGAPLESVQFQELREVTIPNADKAVRAAMDTVRTVYLAMNHDPPSWA